MLCTPPILQLPATFLSSHPFLQAENVLAGSLGEFSREFPETFSVWTQTFIAGFRGQLMRSFSPLTTSCQRTPHPVCLWEAHLHTSLLCPGASLKAFVQRKLKPTWVFCHGSCFPSLLNHKERFLTLGQLAQSSTILTLGGKGRYTSPSRPLSSEWCVTKSQMRKAPQKWNNHFTGRCFAFWERTRSIEIASFWNNCHKIHS